MDDALRRRLREAADAHRPDRERMLARVERGMTGHEPQRKRAAHRPVAPWLRIVGTTAAVAGVFAVGGYGIASAIRSAEPNSQTVATTPTGESTPDRPTATPEPDRSATDPTRRPSETARTPPKGGPTTSGDTEPGPGRPGDTGQAVPAAKLLWADGSIDPGTSAYWGQSNITVNVKKPLTELTVELDITRRDSPKTSGSWLSLPADDFEVSVHESDGAYRYRWTLKDGRTVPTGEHVFAGQYSLTGKQRDAGDDAYTVRAGVGSEQAEWKGDFA